MWSDARERDTSHFNQGVTGSNPVAGRKAGVAQWQSTRLMKKTFSARFTGHFCPPDRSTATSIDNRIAHEMRKGVPS